MMWVVNSVFVGLFVNFMFEYIMDLKDLIKVMFIIGGNLVFFVGGEYKMCEVFGLLELFVCVDIYCNVFVEFVYYVLLVVGVFEC